VSETDTVLVLGCGAVGLGAIAAAARKGANVIALDLDEGKLEQAKRFGADYTINSTRENPQESVDALTNLEGVNVAIEAAGLPETTRLAIELAASVGRVVFIGWAKEEIALQTPFVVRKELDVVGSRNSLHVFPAVIKMLEARERPFTSIISSVVSVEETPRAFADWDAAPQQFAKIMVEIPTK
jgi:threonine dehydrogenase-like Zn-dependent dehydrogenase